MREQRHQSRHAVVVVGGGPLVAPGCRRGRGGPGSRGGWSLGVSRASAPAASELKTNTERLATAMLGRQRSEYDAYRTAQMTSRARREKENESEVQ